MDLRPPNSEPPADCGFYLYSPATPASAVHSGNVFYQAANDQSAKALCRLFQKEYSSGGGGPYFFAVRAGEVEVDEQILLDEALSRLDVYDDPDPGIYDPPPTREMMTLVQYARRARVWESIIAARKDAQWENSPGSEAERQREEPSRGEPEKPKPDLTQMSAEDRTNSALNLLFLLAQAYHKILECAIGTAEWCTALDPELNESYLWVTSNLQSLLKNHEGLRDFPGAFEPAFADLYPSTIRDVEWDDMVAPGAEQFLSSVQRYVLEKGVYPPEEHSPAWILVELFRSSINVAVERAIAYDQRMRAYARKTFGAGQGAKETVKPRPGGIVKTAFISYSWDDDAHCEWVRELATRLRADGVDVSIDRWAAVPGDQLPAFMERAIRENQFVVILCTSRYKHRSDAREGGVGYEGDIMTAEAVTSQNQRKFIPVLRSGEWKQAAPSWLLGKRYIDLSGDPYRERDYEDLVRTLLGIRETAPPLGREMATIAEVNRVQEASAASREVENDDDIRITRVIVEDITQPRNDGAPGSALYSIPFALSRRPSSEWVELFIENWNHPPRRTSMHRPGIAAVSGSTINLSGTTIEEVERYHRDTLQLAVNQTNRQYRERRIAQDQDLARDQALRDSHQTRVENISKKITFD